MKSIYNRVVLLCLLYTMSVYAVAGQGVLIQTGANLVADGNANIVITNAGFLNNGTFTPATSTIKFSGNAATSASFIGGTGINNFYNLSLNKSTNGLQLNANIAVLATLSLDNGDSIFLNNNNIDLGTTGIINGETGSKRITGLTGGYIQRTQVLNSPSLFNPGNIGVVISSSANWGNTIIRRGHVRQTDGLNFGIARYFDFIPTNNSALSATLSINYFDAELSSVNENFLSSYSSPDFGTVWQFTNHINRDAAANFVEVAGLNQLYRITLASTLQPLPVKLLYFNGSLINNYSKLAWATASETDNSYFDIERSDDAITFQKIGSVPSIGNSNNLQQYSFIDNSPASGTNYYRLKQIDINGSYSYSNIVLIRVNYSLKSPSVLYPNPATDYIVLATGNQKLIGTKALLYSQDSKLLQSHIITHTTQHIDIKTMPDGIYYLKLENNEILKFIKK